jgi:hypothetical protein
VDNLLNPAPDQTVRFGLQSWQEMMVGFVSYVWERPETAAELAKHPPRQVDQIFDRLDVNGDGIITQDELPARWKTMAPLAGITIPEKMTRPEFETLFNEIRKRMPARKSRQNPPADKKNAETKTSALDAPVLTSKGFDPTAQGRASAPWVSHANPIAATPKGWIKRPHADYSTPFGVDRLPGRGNPGCASATLG